MADKKQYTVNSGFDLGALSLEISEYLKNTQKLETQSFESNNEYIVQAREASAWKKFSGMDTATTVKLTLSNNILTAEIGKGKWLDKVAGAAVAWFVFAPILVTTAIGVYKQSKLPQSIFAQINDYVNRTILTASQNYQFITCKECGASVISSSAFCSSCGCKLTSNCSSCGSAIKTGERFCRSCGHAV
ncbi:double zinc ribbon [Oxobacter pfennigii]|uniref:Double zinc ribbon n=1 Tax=Oxobacter pfennigii TaxID=36849 RepID=A0A0P9ABS3_9CLOT|nr:zinc ribbon domain-containing protein [Oxobacter pfennigii]KPU42529.1 double zinc ribbon [Oxobacter pfennigii]